MNESVARTAEADRFAISAGMRIFGYVCHEFPRFWSGLENLESSILRDRLDSIEISQPIYVTGLARSGTTILLELLAGFAIGDNPPVSGFSTDLDPVLVEQVSRARAKARQSSRMNALTETESKSRPKVPKQWRKQSGCASSGNSHDPSVSNRLERTTNNAPFASFYRRHIQKLLLIRGGRHYLAKGNYNVARLGYIHELFPDARFVVPIRHPVGHIASLMRQHQVFSRGSGETCCGARLPASRGSL